MRDLLETRRLGGALPEPLPLSNRVETIVRGRLARLSPAAQRVVQAAPVLQSDFDLDLVGKVLNTDPLELIEVWEELEQAQVFKGNRFSHDLLYEAALGAISQPVKALLNRRTAEVLTSAKANPGRVAKHYLAAGERAEATLWLIRAAEVAHAGFMFVEASGFLGQAARIYEEEGETERAFDAYFAQVEPLSNVSSGDEVSHLIEKLQALASTAAQKARVFEAEAHLADVRGDIEAPERAL